MPRPSSRPRPRRDSNVDATVPGGDHAWSPKTAPGISLGFDRGNGSGSDRRLRGDQHGNGKGEFSSGAIKADAKRWFATGNLAYNRR